MHVLVNDHVLMGLYGKIKMEITLRNDLPRSGNLVFKRE